jgi:methylthioribose-1-phosphate isomerase
MVSYDQGRGVVLTPAGECASLDELAAALARDEAEGAGAALLLAALGLALVARQWRGRPPNAQLTAIVQAAARLQGMRPSDSSLRGWMDRGLRVAQDAMLGGNDVEAALVAWAVRGP